QSVINAEKAGAHRLELCSELAIGGITPSQGFIKKVLDAVSIQILLLIRPRSSNLIYSDAELDIMKSDISVCKELGCAGIVSGILNPDNTVDLQRTKELVELSRPMSFTFNRAFDWTPNPYETMKQLIELNVNRILTSGQESSAEKGIFALQQLNKLANGKIGILPAGGIHPDNVLVFKGGGFGEIHASAVLPTVLIAAPKVPLNSAKFFDETNDYTSNKELIQSIITQINDKT